MDNQLNPSPVTEEPVVSDNQSAPQAPTESLGAAPSNTTNLATPTVAQPASSRRKLWLIIGVVAVLVIAGLLTYMVLRHNDKTTKTATQTSTATTGDTPVKDVTSAMTQGAGNESTITNTDDSGTAASMNQSAGNVGGSVNENNF